MFVLVVHCRFAVAQDGDISQELQLFNSLSPDQQQAILQQLGSGGGGNVIGAGVGGGLAGLGGGLSSRFGSGLSSGGLSQSGSQSALLQQRLLLQQRQQQEESDFGNPIPVFKAGDTVLVDIQTKHASSPAAAAAPVGPQTPAAQASATSDANGPPNSASTGLSATQLSQLAARGVVPPQSPPAESPPSDQAPSAEDLQRVEDLVQLVRAHNPYQLDSNGELLLPGIPPVTIAGLTEDLASRRIAAEPAFQYAQVKLTRLPVRKAGREALKPFGYDLFDNSASSLFPVLDVPVPADYVVGPGDVLQVQLFGNQNRETNLLVSRDGRVDFPQLGPIDVGGRRYSEVKADIEGRVARQLVGVHANVSIGETRTINVFVLGAAKYPGSYTLSGLATVTTALFAAGGVSKTGSLRNIEVKRQGETVRTFDLYDLLMRGDSSDDIKLLPGDVVFIPPVGPTVSLYGEIMRPAIYEIKGNQTLGDLLSMGGGMTANADRNSAALVRVDEQQQRVVLNVDPSVGTNVGLTLRNGDALEIGRLNPQIDSGVTVQGYVYQPRYFAWRAGLRLSDVLPSVEDLKPDADQHYLIVRRELPPDRHVTVLSADLVAALRARGSAADVPLMARDIITVFDLETSRQYVIRGLMDDLRLQSDISAPTPIVHIDGRVKVPGDYPLESGMRISDLIRAGGSLLPSAYGGRAELSRYTVINGNQRRTQVLSVDLNALQRGDSSQDLVLQPFDRLSVKEVSGWTEQGQVTLLGEVRFPGSYSIREGETLRSVIQRAGGLTNYAFPLGAIFTRVQLKEQEQEQLDRLAERMRTDIAEMALMGTRAGLGGSESAIGIGQTLLAELQGAKAVGRLVINLDAAVQARPGTSNDVILQNGDELVVPRQRQEVMVLGEVQDATSHLYHPGLSRDDYIDQSGGVTRQADRKQIYVVRADGSVVTGRHGWFRDADGVRILPGDAIVVPLNTVKLPALTLWQQATGILYNLSIAAVALHSFAP